MTTTVLASAFKPSDWWDEPVFRDPVDPESWTRSLQVAIPSTDPNQPTIVEISASDDAPAPVVEFLTSEHTLEDLDALYAALPHILSVLDQINEEIR